VNWDEIGSIGRFTVKPLPRGFYVYVAWGEDRTRPLYIGRAVNLWRRFEQHAQWKAAWVAEVVELECYEFPTERMADMAETDAILALNPVHNVVRRPQLRRKAA
jgi:excinuclease UvrABC nuclease subunit